MPIQLEESEQKLFDECNKYIIDLKKNIREIDKKESKIFDSVKITQEMAKKAHELHMLLKKRGIEIKHSKIMLRNRGVSPDNIEELKKINCIDGFIISSSEDLLNFIQNPNEEHQDTTLNNKFDFDFYSRRWGSFDHYTITRINEGWAFKGSNLEGIENSNKEGKPGLFTILNHDSVCYPAKIGKLFEWLWNRAADGATKDEVQQAISDIGKWISICEKNTPTTDLFREYL